MIKANKFKSLKTRVLDISQDTIFMNSIKYGGILNLSQEGASPKVWWKSLAPKN